MSNQDLLKKKYLLAVNIKPADSNNVESEIFEFTSKEDRDSVIEELSQKPNVTWATSDIVLH